MGLGDVKLAILLGAFLGLDLLIVWLLLAFLTGAITGCILILAGRAKMKTKIAFGPFLIIGAYLALFWGNKFLSLIGLSWK